MRQSPSLDVIALAAGDTPRCVVSGGQAYPNAAFSALPTPEREHVIRTILSASDPPPFIDAGKYRFAVVPLEPLSCTMVTGVPLETPADERMRLLPSILNFSRGLTPNAANLHRLIDMLLAADPSLVESAVLFESKNGAAFAPLHVAPNNLKGARLRGWPLEFASARRRATTVAQQGTQRQALALPFIVSTGERYVVLAILRTRTLSESDRNFLRSISCVCDRTPGLRTLPWPSESVFSMPQVTVAYYGAGPVDERCASLFSAWEWQVRPLSYASAANSDVVRADLVVVDGRSLSRAASILRMLRAAAPRALVVYLGRATPEIEALADEVLPPDASALAAGRVFKQIAREMREARLREGESAMSREIATWRSIASVAELTRRLASLLSDTVADWACVHIVEDDGTPHAAESPESEARILPELPDFFLAGYSLFKPHVDDDFFREISKDIETQERLRALGASSGAAVPITANGALIGCAIVLSMRELYDPDHFDRISRAAAAAGNVYEQIRRRAPQPQSAAPAVYSNYQAEAYSGPESDAHASVSVTSSAITIELTGPGNARLSGRVETQSGVLSFDGTSIAEPLIVTGRGVLPLLPLHGRERRVTLFPGSIVLLYPSAMAPAIDRGEVAATLQQLASNKQWSVKEALAQKLGSGAVFAAISAADD